MFVQRLNELLRETNTSRTELSKKTGIPLTTMWGWSEKGTQPSADKVIKIADFFEVSTDYLLGRSNDVGIIETNANLTPDQNELLNLYNRMSFQNKNRLLGFAQGLIY